MARIQPLPPDDFAPELRAELGPALDRPDQLGSLRVWARRPDLAGPLHTFMHTVMARATLGPRLIELVRLRVAFHNQCRSCMARRSPAAVEDGVSEDLVCELVTPEEAPDLTDRERAALAYADRLSVAHQDMDDALFDRLRLHFTDGEIVELGLHIGVFLGFGRVAMSWDLVDDLPDGLRVEGRVGPWDAVAPAH